MVCELIKDDMQTALAVRVQTVRQSREVACMLIERSRGSGSAGASQANPRGPLTVRKKSTTTRDFSGEYCADRINRTDTRRQRYQESCVANRVSMGATKNVAAFQPMQNAARSTTQPMPGILHGISPA